MKKEINHNQKKWYYLGFTYNQLESIWPEIKKDNLRILKHVSLFAGIILFISFLFPLFFKKSKYELIMYLILAIYNFINYYTTKISIQKEIYKSSEPRNRFYYSLQIYAYIFVTYAFGIHVGVFSNPNSQATIIFLFMLFIGSLFTTTIPGNIIPLLISLITFNCCSIRIKPSSAWMTDLFHSIVVVLLNSFVYWQTSVLRFKQKLEELRLSETHISLWDMSNKDFLTKLYNRRKFNELSQKLLISRDLSKTTLAIAIIDIDDFRDYNDTYGHDNGDSALILMSQKFIESAVAHEIVICRWGGEEFMAMWPSATSEDAQSVAEEIRRNIEDLHISNITKDGEKYLTVIIGLHGLSGRHTETWEEIYHNTYELLGRAKKLGRNRIEFSLN